MRLPPNRLKALLRDGEIALGCSLHEARDPGAIRTMACAGADLVFIDLEHNPHGMETVVDLVAHAHGVGITPLVRPPIVDEAWVGRLLDGGCQSLLIPRIRTPEEVQHLLELTHYRPEGRRGLATYGGAGVAYQQVTDVGAVLRWANQELLIGVVIETPEAVEALEDILVPRLDLAVMGWGDLSHLYGVEDARHPLVQAAAQRVRDLCHRRGIAYGVFEPNVAALPSACAEGAQLLVSGGVFQFIHAGVRAARQALDSYRPSPRRSGLG
ncbi:aldolase/citrate lyase family protein [Nocardioides sp. AN3]